MWMSVRPWSRRRWGVAMAIVGICACHPSLPPVTLRPELAGRRPRDRISIRTVGLSEMDTILSCVDAMDERLVLESRDPPCFWSPHAVSSTA